MEWNKEQKKAIELRDKNILVSAGAGSGKTTVLTQRIINLIKEGNSINDFLICTFTEDATSQMKDKIRAALIKEKMFDQADLVQIANISTFHSFCKKVICDNFDVLSLPPKFHILKDDTVLRSKSMNETLNLLYEDEKFVEFTVKFSPNNDETIKTFIDSAFNFLSNIPDGYNWFLNQIKEYEKGNYSNIFSAYCANLANNMRHVLTLYENFLGKKYANDEVYFSNPNNLDEKALSFLINEYNTLATATEYLHQNDLRKFILTISFLRLTLKADEETKKTCTNIRKVAKDELKAAKAFLSFFDEDDMMQSIHIDLSQLYKGVSTFNDIFSKNKLENNYMSFNDLEKYAYLILCDTATANQYRDKFRYVFVDEYQDTSKIQQEIISKIVRPNNLFMVGDIKQSIYGFRNADPSMFYKLYNEYEYEGENIKIDLNMNYRSNENILNCVNDISSLLLNLNNQYYNLSDYLKTDRNFGQEPVEIDVINNDEDDLTEEKVIVNHIKDLTSKGYKYGDIAILFRNFKGGKADPLKKLLKENGIPVYLGNDSQKGMYVDVSVFLDLLFLINNPINDITLLSVLYSDIVKLSATDLIELKCSNLNENQYYYKIKYILENEKEHPLYDKLKAFFDMLNFFREKSINLSVGDLILMVLEKTGYIKYLETVDDSKAKISQMYNIVNLANDYEAQGMYGLSSFLAYYSQLKNNDRDLEIVSQASGDNVVRIMSVHKSKGLEFPVVILADTDEKIYKPNNEAIFKHKDIGLGLKFIDPKYNITCHNPLTMVISDQCKSSEIEESMRVLYVALTRAKEKLIITGCLKKQTLDYNTPPNLKAIKAKTPYLEILLQTVMYLKNTEKNLGNYNINFIDKIILENRHKIEPKKIDVLFDEEIESILNMPKDFNITDIPQKTSVTKIVSKENNNFNNNQGILTKKTSNITQNKTNKISDGAKKGTIIHMLLSIIKPNETYSELISRCLKDKFINENDLELIDENQINNFIQSDLYKQILLSPKVYKEKPFIMYLEPSYGYTDEKTMVQGIIDCMFEYEDGYIIVDYKTDNIVKNADEKLIEKYSGQLMLYKLAIEKLTQKPVKKCIIYHTKTGKIIEL